ncbi:MAG: polymerase, sigma 28 subunit, FliA/WhiG [Bacteriovoracaceae bacterium]|nr:polymerase, sigma 28 subunit, FliA/WhiG [Bacteriovoracaceae bacterium]
MSLGAYKKAAKRSLSAAEKGELIERYTPLVKIAAYRLMGRLPRHLMVDDLIACGNLGLLEAIQAFDPALMVKFETYAKFRIRGAMLDELRLKDWLPRGVRVKMREIDTLHRKLSFDLQRMPDDKDMAAALKMKLEEYYEYIIDLQPAGMLSYDELCGGKYSAQADVLKFIEDKTSPHPDIEVQLKEVKGKIIDAIQKLDQEEQLMMALYYYEGLTFTEIAEVIGVSDQRVCQMHSKALMKLRWRLDSYRPEGSRRTQEEQELISQNGGGEMK